MDAIAFLNKLAAKPVLPRHGEHLQIMEKLAVETVLMPYPIPLTLITGTCGKGSTANFLSAVLEANGYSVGMIQSPHLISFNERILVNRKPVGEQDILDKIQEWMPFLAQMDNDHLPNYNQMFLTVGLHLFRDRKVDFVIVESGIGGYSDPCSYFSPILSIITNIHKDHEFLLGNTYEQIAMDKSGIIKESRPIVTGTTRADALQVITAEAKKKAAPLFALGQDFWVSANGRGEGLYQEDNYEFPYHLQVMGEFQWHNTALVLKAGQILRQMGYVLKETKTRAALNETILPARLQIVSEHPLTIIDGAHNEEEIERFCEAVSTLPCKKRCFIMGFSSNKNITKILELFKGLAGIFCFVPHSNRMRAKDPKELAEACEALGFTGQAFDSLRSAYDFAASHIDPDTDGIFFTGSMFLAGDALKLLHNGL